MLNKIKTNYLFPRQERDAYIPETGKPEIIELGWSDCLSVYLADKVLKDWIVALDKREIGILDFGCGTGDATVVFGGVAEHFRNKHICTTGYDPNLQKAACERSLATQRLLRRCPEFFRFVDELPPHADIVIRHFSLHHVGEDLSDLEAMAELRDTLKEDIRGVDPTFLAIAEADYTGADFSEDEIGLGRFINTFGSTDAGKQELKMFIARAGRDFLKGSENCYKFHRRFSQADYLDFVQKAGYKIEQIIKGTSHAPPQKYRFIITAKKM